MSTINDTHSRASNSTARAGAQTSARQSSKSSTARAICCLQASIESIGDHESQDGESREALARLLGNTVPPGWVNKLPIGQVQAMLKMHQNPKLNWNLLVKNPTVITALLAGGISVSEIAQATDAQLTALQAANPVVLKALLDAGMRLADVALLAASVTPKEAASTDFMATVKAKLNVGVAVRDAVIMAKLNIGVAVRDAVIMARYSSIATEKELADPAFRNDLAQAASQTSNPADTVHFARASLLVRRLEGAINPLTALALDDAVLNALLAEDPAAMRSFLALGLTLAQYLQTPPQQRDALLGANSESVRALLGAGMAIADVAVFAGTVSIAEAINPAFMSKLTEKLGAGLSAPDALLWARFSGLATNAELSDPQFLEDLSQAGVNGHGTPPEALRHARALLLARRLNIDPLAVLPLSLAETTSLLNIDPTQITGLLARGLSLQQISQTNNAERATLLGGDERLAKLVRALLGTGMNVHEVAAYAGSVVSPEEATPEFIEKLRVRIAGGASGAAAIAGARYGNMLSAKELANPKFLQDLLHADTSAAPAGQVERAKAMAMINSLSYARDHVDIFEAAEHVALPGSNPRNGWFSNAGVAQLSSMSTNSAEWAQIETTVGRGLSTGERQAAITAAKGMAENWTYLCKNARALNLSLREGTTNVLDFKAYQLPEVNMSPLNNLLGNAPATVSGQALNVISALEYTRSNVNIFEAAEKLAVDPSNSSDGSFDRVGVNQLAQMEVDDAGWSKIEATIGHVLSTADRQLAISAAKGLNDNWGLLCTRAGRIGLSLRKGTTNAIDFTSDNMRQLNFGALLDTLGVADTRQLLNSLKFARAKELEKDLSTDGVPTAGAYLATITSLSTAQVDELLALDPAAVKTFLAQARPLSEIANLNPAQAEGLAKIDPDLMRWLLSLADYGLSDLSQLNTPQLAALQKAKTEGYRNARAGENFDNISAETISRPISLGGGMLTFETKAGGKIIVTKNSNFDLYTKVSGLQQSNSKKNIDAVRTQYNLPPAADVDVMSMTTTIFDQEGAPDSSGEMTVSQRAINTLMDKYRGMLKRGEMDKQDPRAKLVRAIDARSALSNGYSLLPYRELGSDGLGTRRTYPGDEDNPTYSTMSPRDVAELLDPAKVDGQIAKLMGNPTIQKDFQGALNASVNTLPAEEKQALTDQLYNALTSPAYTQALEALKNNGQAGAAEEMTRADLAALALLDPAKLKKAALTLSTNAALADLGLQKLMENPALIDDKTFDQATTDVIAVTIQAMRSGTAVIRHSTQRIADVIKYLEEFKGDKKAVTALAAVIKELVIQAKKPGATFNLGDVSQADFDAAMAKTYVPLDMRGKLAGFFGTTQKFGMWGSIGGAIALASFGYKLSKKAWGKDSTAQERLGAARDILSVFSVGNHIQKSFAGVADYFLSLVGKNAGGEMAWKAMGLDRTLPGLFGKESFLPKNAVSWEAWWKNYDDTADVSRMSLAEKAVADSTAHLFEPKVEGSLPGGSVLRIGMSAVRVLAAAGDVVGGIADIVLGGIGLHKSIGEGDKAGIAANSLGIIAGVAATAAGVIGTAGLFGTLPFVIAATAGPLFIAAAGLAVVAMGVTVITGDIKRHNQLQVVSDDQAQWFQDLANDGLAAPDLDNKLEYLRYAFSTYGNDNTNAGNQSYFEFQHAEWKHFQNTPGKDGSSVNRLDKNDHIRTKITKDLPELGYQSSSSAAQL